MRQDVDLLIAGGYSRFRTQLTTEPLANLFYTLLVWYVNL